MDDSIRLQAELANAEQRIANLERELAPIVDLVRGADRQVVQTPSGIAGFNKQWMVPAMVLGDVPADEADAAHPWKVTVFANEDGTLTASIASESLFFGNLAALEDTLVTGYSKDTGAEITGMAVGDFIYIEIKLDNKMTISNPQIGTGALPGTGGDGLFMLAGATPDYATIQYLPIAKIKADDDDSFKVVQFVRNHIRLGIVAADGILIYQPIAS